MREESVGIPLLMRRFSTAAVLFHHALAEGLQLGPTDLKCLDLIRERPPRTSSELARMTGLTTGAVTGVVARLEAAGFVRREADPTDGRKQNVFPIPTRLEAIREALRPLKSDLAGVMRGFDADELQTIGRFLAEAERITRVQAAKLRALEAVRQ